MSEQKIKELGAKYLRYLEQGNREAANAVRLTLNRLVCRETQPRIFIGNDEYFSQEGAVSGSVSVKSLVLIEARDAEE